MFPTSVTYIAELGNARVRWGEVIVKSGNDDIADDSARESCTYPFNPNKPQS